MAYGKYLFAWVGTCSHKLRLVRVDWSASLSDLQRNLTDQSIPNVRFGLTAVIQAMSALRQKRTFESPQIRSFQGLLSAALQTDENIRVGRGQLNVGRFVEYPPIRRLSVDPEYRRCQQLVAA